MPSQSPIEQIDSRSYADRHLIWNFTVLAMDCCFFWAGLVFFDPNIVLPTFLDGMNSPNWIVGLARLLQILGLTLPGLVAAHRMHGGTRHKTYLLTVCGIGRLGLFTVPWVISLFAHRYPQLVIAWFLVFWTIFWISNGLAAVPWFDIVGKSIPARIRGRFFGVIQLVGGSMAIGATNLAGKILRTPGAEFAHTFAFLAMLWWGGTLLSEIALCLIREPEGEPTKLSIRPPFAIFVRDALPRLRKSPRAVRLILIRLSLDGLSMAAPFYVLYARHTLHVSANLIALYLFVQSVGKLTIGLISGMIADKYGPIMGLRVIAGGIAVIPILALAAGNINPIFLFGSFFLLGAAQDGMWALISNALMESVDPEDRPFTIGTANWLIAPGSLYAVLGGVISDQFGYRTAFCAALITGFIGFELARRTPGIMPATPLP